MAEVERVLVLPAVREPADQQELPRVRRAQERPVRVAGALRPVPAGPLLEHRLGNCPVSTGDLVPRERDPVVTRDDDDVGQAEAAQRVPEVRRPAVHLVRGGPQDPDPRRHQAFYLGDRQFRLRRERQALRDPRLLPAFRVARPAVRHVHVEINPGLPEDGDQGGEHPGHAVFHFPGHPGVLRRHACGGVALAQVSGLVERQARADLVTGVIPQDLLRQPGQCRAYCFPPPFTPAQEALDPVRTLMPCLLRQVPCVRPDIP